MDDVPPRRSFPWPAVLLYFLSPVVAELLTSSSPPSEFFTPFGLTVMSLLYGSGALLVRELSLRWKAGWPGRFILGLSYGIAEEGLMVKSFFDPTWPDLGLLARYGRLWGVNWVWSLELAIFHSLFSICVPIMLVELLFPRWRDRSWLGTPGLIVFTAFFVADVLFGALAMAPYKPATIAYAAALILAAGLTILARHLPRVLRFRSRFGPEALPAGSAARPLPFFLLGLGSTVVFFIITWVVPSTGIPPLLTMTFVLYVVVGFFVGQRELEAALRRSPAHQWALASGALAFFVAVAPLGERDPGRHDNPKGMTIVGLAAAALLLAGYILVRRRHERRESAVLAS